MSKFQNVPFDPHEPCEFLLHLTEAVTTVSTDFPFSHTRGDFLALDILAKASEVNMYHWFDRWDISF